MAVTNAPQYDSSTFQADTYSLHANYLGRLNELHEAVSGKQIRPLVTNINKMRQRTGQMNMSDANRPDAWYLFNGHPLGLRFALYNEKVWLVTYAVKGGQGEQPTDLRTSDMLNDSAMIRTLEENKESLDGLVSIILKAAKAIT